VSAVEVVGDVALAGGPLLFAGWLTRGRRTVKATIGAATIGSAVAVTTGWLFTRTAERDITAMLAIVFGLGAGIVGGIAWGRLPLRRGGEDPPRRPRWSIALIALTVVATLLVGGWIGANSPRETWLGPIVSHGDRNGSLVALTFDDGPNVHATLEIARILDSFGAKGTFFTVGKALDARPDISRALLADGQLLGNHSYHHDEWRWLDPRYPELERTQSAFRRRLGVCPAFYRPPHGQHTPFMSYQLARKHMTMVGWDTSASDFATTDGRLVARRILRRVRPGSIVVLHDGIDGNLTADRSVLTVALPLILRGLEARGLHAVPLDRLLGIRGYDDSHC
jgi:peptidoglycan/xylan/chitin deacetylase (PgdA/CDA1 family)